MSVGLFGLGYLSIGTQVYLLREFSAIFGGNEYVTGLLLTLWMLLTGIGAMAGRFVRRNAVAGEIVLLFTIAITFATAMVLFPVYLRMGMVDQGSMTDVFDILFAAVILLSPFCLINGYLFVRLCSCHPGRSVSASYAVESAGSIMAGGATGVIILLGFDASVGMKSVLGGALLSMALFALFQGGRIRFSALLIFPALWLFSGLQFPSGRQLLFPGQQLILSRETPYGRVDVTLSGNQKNYYENGILLFSDRNEIMAEEDVHPAMVQVKDPRNVLLISGGLAGTITEVLKYNPDRIDYVELNPALPDIASLYTNLLDDRRIHVHATDARAFIRETTNRYDVVLVNLPAPSTLQLNRLYTTECMAGIKSVMNSGGVVSYTLPTTSDYTGKASASLNSVVYSALSEHFRHIKMIPLERNHLLASDSTISLDIPGRIEWLKIPTVFVNKHYIDQHGLMERSGYLESNLDPAIMPNHDFKPVALLYHFSWWLSALGHGKATLILIPLLLLAVLVLLINPVNAGLFTGGFTLASFEMILIITAQVWLGYAFQLTGLIILACMAGLAIGAGINPVKTIEKSFRFYIAIQLGLGVLSLLFVWLILHGNDFIPTAGGKHMVLFTIAGVVSSLTGLSFRMASQFKPLSDKSIAPSNYAADLFGAAAGSFITTLIVFPLAGLAFTGVFIALVNIAGAVVVVVKGRNSLSL